jgi:small subunit ribosomal protein S16
MVVIRLSRQGAKKRPFYRIVVADNRKPCGGRYLERVGYYNPIAAGKETRLLINVERVNHWTAQGAQLSDHVASLLKTHKKQPVKPSEEETKPLANEVEQSGSQTESETEKNDTPTE